MPEVDAVTKPWTVSSNLRIRHQVTPNLPAQLSALTSLRFIAALWVVLFHFRHTLSFDIDEITPFFGKGEVAVDFFFFMSGFVLAHVYLDMIKDGQFSSRDFLLRRLARVYPLHLATLGLLTLSALVGMSSGPGSDKLSLTYLPANLLLVHAWGITTSLSFNGPSWSISAEWFAYLLFPALAGLLARRPWPLNAWLIGSLMLLGILWLMVPTAIGRDLTQLTYDFGIARVVPEFTLGMIAFRYFRQHPPSALLSRVLAISSSCGLILGAHLDVPQIVLVSFCPLLIFGAAGLSAHGRDGILASRLLVYFGEVSYSVYLIHPLVRRVWSLAGTKLLSPRSSIGLELLWLASGLVAVLVAAIACYHLIELPSRRFLVSKRGPRPISTTTVGLASS